MGVRREEGEKRREEKRRKREEKGMKKMTGEEIRG